MNTHQFLLESILGAHVGIDDYGLIFVSPVFPGGAWHANVLPGDRSSMVFVPCPQGVTYADFMMTTWHAVQEQRGLKIYTQDGPIGGQIIVDSSASFRLGRPFEHYNRQVDASGKPVESFQEFRARIVEFLRSADLLAPERIADMSEANWKGKIAARKDAHRSPTMPHIVVLAPVRPSSESSPSQQVADPGSNSQSDHSR